MFSRAASRKYSDEAKRQQAIGRRDEWRNTLRKTFQEVDAIALPVLQKAPMKRNLFLTGIFEARFLKIQNIALQACQAGKRRRRMFADRT